MPPSGHSIWPHTSLKMYEFMYLINESKSVCRIFFLVKDVYVLVFPLLSTCNYISTIGKKKWVSSACIVFIFIFILIISIIYLWRPNVNIGEFQIVNVCESSLLRRESSLLRREKLTKSMFFSLNCLSKDFWKIR